MTERCSCGYIFTLGSNWERVTTFGQEAYFPDICPHCLRKANIPLRLESDGRGIYIVVGVLRRYHTIHVPFCKTFAKQVGSLRRFSIVSIVLALASMVVADAYIGISSAGAFIIGVVIGGTPLVIQHLYRNPNKYIRVTAVRKDSIDFSISNPAYASAFRQVNATTT